MTARLLRAVLILPGTVLVYVPALLLWLGHGTCMGARWAGPAGVRGWLALALALPGIVLGLWTLRLFVRRGEGTPAPWDPPQRLVVLGPYRHVRNPMISGVLLMLLAEVLVAGSWLLAGWLGVFMLGNAVYFPWVEEKGLKRRFGSEYSRYCEHVPRWLPRLRPWRGDTH